MWCESRLLRTSGARRSVQACLEQWFWWRKAAGHGSPRSPPRCWSPSCRCWSSARRCPCTSGDDWKGRQRQITSYIKINRFWAHWRRLYLGNPSQRVHNGVQLRASSRKSSAGFISSMRAASLSSSVSSERVWMTRSTTWDWAVWAFITETASL